jgi:hypothetical protein
MSVDGIDSDRSFFIASVTQEITRRPIYVMSHEPLYSSIVVTTLRGTASSNSTRITCTLDTMDFSLNDHQKLIRATVRQFMKNEVRPSVSGNGGVTGAGGDKFCQVPNGHVS